MATDTDAAPKIWRGRFYEDFDVGDVYPSRLGRTVTETDNIWFTCLTLNTNQVHFNAVQSERGLHGRTLVNSTFTLALITVSIFFFVAAGLALAMRGRPQAQIASAPAE